MNYMKRYGFFFVCLIFVVYTLYFFSASQSIKKEFSIFEKIVYVTTQPLESGLNAIQEFFSNTYHSYINVYNAKQEADLYKKESMELKIQLQSLGDIKQENARLRKLLDLQQMTHLKFLTCEVIGGDSSFVYKSIRINKGEKNGLEYGMGVVSGNGVVGVVMRVSKNTADVLLITDPNSNLDVIVARNRKRGILQGGLSQIMEFKYFESTNHLLIGDEIVTSGLTGAFPSGLSVGKVVQLEQDADFGTQIVRVNPSVDFSELNEVLVLLAPNREIDIIKKIGGIDWIKNLVNLGAVKNVD